MSNRQHFDLFVIGAGSGGVRAARMAASQGKKVAIAEIVIWEVPASMLAVYQKNCLSMPHSFLNCPRRARALDGRWTKPHP